MIVPPSRARVVLAGALLTGCGDPSGDSCEYETDEFSVVALGVDNGLDMRVEVDFDASDRTAFTTPIELCDDDVLTIAGETPERTDRIDRIVYSVNFEVADAPRDVEVVLERKSPHESVQFTMQVPPAFDVLAPLAEAMVPRGADFLLEWAPPDDGEQIRIGLTEEIGAGFCLETSNVDHDYKSMVGVAVDDTGMWTIPADVVANPDDADCEAVYSFKRLRPAPYPEAHLHGGYVEGRTERSVAFRSIP